jgi:glycosyltransferase involved in cell wall biosynthesis
MLCAGTSLMRIGFDTLIENPLRPSSAINYLKSVLRALVRIAPEHQFVVFVSPRNRKLFQVDAPNVAYVMCWASNEHIPARILTQQLQYPALVRRHRVDVLHALNQLPLAASCASVVKICTLHHYVTPDAFKRSHAVARVARIELRLRLAYRRVAFDWSARKATIVMANSEATRALIELYMRVPSERVAVVYESVDDLFVPADDVASKRAAVKARFGLERPYLLYVSNLWFYKNPDGAIRAFAEQRRRYADDLDLVIVGHDDYGRTPELAALAEAEGVRERVKFLGQVKRFDLLELYQGAHILFYPSFAETFGKPVVEGMRSGVPVVAARAGSLPELMGDAGLSADPGNIVEMAEALHRVSADDVLRRQMVARGLARGREFSWEATARGTIALCERAVSQWRRDH